MEATTVRVTSSGAPPWKATHKRDWSTASNIPSWIQRPYYTLLGTVDDSSVGLWDFFVTHPRIFWILKNSNATID